MSVVDLATCPPPTMDRLKLPIPLLQLPISFLLPFHPYLLLSTAFSPNIDVSAANFPHMQSVYQGPGGSGVSHVEDSSELKNGFAPLNQIFCLFRFVADLMKISTLQTSVLNYLSVNPDNKAYFKSRFRVVSATWSGRGMNKNPFIRIKKHKDLEESFENPRGQGYGHGDLEMGTQNNSNSAELGLDGFFKKVQSIEKQYEKLNKLLRKLQDAHEESKAVTKVAAMKGCSYFMEKDVDEVGKVARFIKLRNLTRRQKPGCGKGTGVDRSRTTTTLSLKKKFKDKMSEFQALRESIHQEHREVVERRVYTVTGTRADEETIDQLIETGDSEQIFQKAIREKGRGQILDTLAEIQERHHAVREVEKKLLDLQQVSGAVDHVQDGNKALYKAKSLQKNSRKWMCIAILILLIIVAVVVVVVGVLKPWKTNNGA
ncbi:unnamed protein product [Lactuca virosa]|uniref:Syntaxin N-terminal domain-containing protein n=1 Tax=Lactuca virosa TaxID=75947 RepID=A0AAU9NV68_9ASTR|nr:unnamed protein product [Lactuca virosa]